MSVVTALSLVLFVGFVATGVVGFLGWRQRMREGAVSAPLSPDALTVSTRLRQREIEYDLEGARL